MVHQKHVNDPVSRFEFVIRSVNNVKTARGIRLSPSLKTAMAETIILAVTTAIK